MTILIMNNYIIILLDKYGDRCNSYQLYSHKKTPNSTNIYEVMNLQILNTSSITTKLVNTPYNDSQIFSNFINYFKTSTSNLRAIN